MRPHTYPLQWPCPRCNHPTGRRSYAGCFQCDNKGYVLIQESVPCPKCGGKYGGCRACVSGRVPFTLPVAEPDVKIPIEDRCQSCDPPGSGKRWVMINPNGQRERVSCNTCHGVGKKPVPPTPPKPFFGKKVAAPPVVMAAATLSPSVVERKWMRLPNPDRVACPWCRGVPQQSDGSFCTMCNAHGYMLMVSWSGSESRDTAPVYDGSFVPKMVAGPVTRKFTLELVVPAGDGKEESGSSQSVVESSPVQESKAPKTKITPRFIRRKVDG